MLNVRLGGDLAATRKAPPTETYPLGRGGTPTELGTRLFTPTDHVKPSQPPQVRTLHPLLSTPPSRPRPLPDLIGWNPSLDPSLEKKPPEIILRAHFARTHARTNRPLINLPHYVCVVSHSRRGIGRILQNSTNRSDIDSSTHGRLTRPPAMDPNPTEAVRCAKRHRYGL